MRLGVGRAVVHQLHFLTGDVDQLVVFRVQRTGRQEAVLGELAQRNQPLAIGFAGFGQRGMQVTRLVLHVELLLDVVDLLAVVGAHRVGHVPLDHLAVDEQRGVGVAATVKGGVQRAEAQFRLGGDHVARVLQLVVEEVIELGDLDHGDGR